MMTFHDVQNAVKKNDVEAVKKAIESGFDVNARPKADTATLLMTAAYNYQYDMSKLLLENGASKHLLGYKNESLFVDYSLQDLALEIAAKNGHNRLISLLLEFGFDPDGNANAPVTLAIGNVHFEALDILLKNGASSDFSKSRYFISAAQVAISLGGTNLLMLKKAVSLTQDINIRDGLGRTSLEFLVFCREWPEGAELLLNAGVDPFIKNKQGLNALDMARKWDRKGTMLMLEQHILAKSASSIAMPAVKTRSRVRL